MEICICAHIIDVNNTSATENVNIGRTYNFMECNSPYFATNKELMEWYKSQPIEMKLKAISKVNNKPYLFVYSHDVAINDFDMNGYKASKGEILSTDECYIYSFTAKCWNGHPNFDL